MRLARIPRYIVVGAICAGIYNVVMILADALRVHYVASTGIAFVIIVIVGYALHCFYTFSEPPTPKGFVRYTSAMLLTLPLSLGAMFLVRDLCRAPMWLASPAVTGLLFAWNFVAAHWAVTVPSTTKEKSVLDEVSS
jgi:putative flippase GtrA